MADPWAVATVTPVQDDPWKVVTSEPRKVATKPKAKVEAENPILRRADAFMRGAADTMTFGLADEIAGGLNSLVLGNGPLGGAIAAERSRDALDRRELPVSRGAGQIAGAFATPGAGAASRFVGAGATGTAKVARAAATGAAAGAAYGAGSGTDAGSRLEGAGMGGALGAATGGAFQVGSNVLASKAASGSLNAVSPQRQLSRQNVTLTPGRILGGPAARIEDAMTSVPFVGDPIRRAQIRSIDSFDRAATNRTLAPLNDTLPETIKGGRAAVKYAGDRIAKAYDDALSNVTVAPDAQFSQAVQAAKQGLTPSAAAEVNSILANTITPNFSGPVNGKQLKVLDSELGSLAQDYMKQGGLSRYTAQAILKIQDALDDALGRTNPQALAAKNAADEAYANLIRLEGAASSSGARGGQFTASQLNQSVRRSDPGRRKARYARGEAIMQDLTDPAMEVLPQTVPDSGTPFRNVALGGGGAAAAGLVNPALVAKAITAIGAMNAIYSRPAVNALNALYRATDNQAASKALAELSALAARHPELQPIYGELLGVQRGRAAPEQQMTPTG